MNLVWRYMWFVIESCSTVLLCGTANKIFWCWIFLELRYMYVGWFAYLISLWCLRWCGVCSFCHTADLLNVIAMNKSDGHSTYLCGQQVLATSLLPIVWERYIRCWLVPPVFCCVWSICLACFPVLIHGVFFRKILSNRTFKSWLTFDKSMKYLMTSFNLQNISVWTYTAPGFFKW